MSLTYAFLNSKYLLVRQSVRRTAVYDAAIADEVIVVCKRSVIISLLIVITAVTVLFYVTEGSARREVAQPTASRQYAAKRAKARNINSAPDALKAAHKPQGQYSKKEYALLRQRYKPNPPAADGALKGWVLKQTLKTMKMNLYQRKSWPLVKAALSGNAPALRNALDTGVSTSTTVYLYQPYNANVPLLDFAIMGGQRSIVKLLIDHGAALDPSGYGTPFGGRFKTIAPLALAAGFSEDGVIRVLLNHGANIEQRNDFDENNSTALPAAAAGGAVSTVYL